MRLALVHADRLAFEATRPVDRSTAESEDAADAAAEVTDCVAAFCTVEPGDGADPDGIGTSVAGRLESLAADLNTDRVALVPTELLADGAAGPGLTARVLDAVADGTDLAVSRAPAGWYVDLELAREAHPLSDTALRVRPDEANEEDTPRDDEWRVVTADGTVVDPTADAAGVAPRVRRVLDAERSNDGDPAPPIPERLRRRGLADADPYGRSGLRWFPRGTAVRDRIRTLVERHLPDGSHRVATPGRIDPDAAPVSDHLAAVGVADRSTRTGRRPSVPPATAVGHRSLLSDATLRAGELPVRIHELGGEIAGRRADTSAGDDGSERGAANVGADPPGPSAGVGRTPVVTAVCSGLDEAREELRRQAETALSIGEALGVEHVPVVRTDRRFFERHRGWVTDLAGAFERPVVVELGRDRRGKAIVVDLFVPEGERVLAGPTVAIDGEGADRFGVTVEGLDGSPVIVESTPVGPLARTVAAAVDAGLDRHPPGFPVRLAPTQVRLIPVTRDHHGLCRDLLSELSAVAADVDDRPLAVDERLDRAAADWVPFRVVVGDHERDREALSVVRATGREETLSPAGLRERVLDAVDGHPRSDAPVESLDDSLRPFDARSRDG